MVQSKSSPHEASLVDGSGAGVKISKRLLSDPYDPRLYLLVCSSVGSRSILHYQEPLQFHLLKILQQEKFQVRITITHFPWYFKIITQRFSFLPKYEPVRRLAYGDNSARQSRNIPYEYEGNGFIHNGGTTNDHQVSVQKYLKYEE